MKNPIETGKVSILLFGTQMAVAGAQAMLLSQARWFHARGYAVTAAFLYDRDGLAESWRKDNPFPVLDLEGRKTRGGFIPNALRLGRGLWRLFRLLRRERFAVIETFTPHSNVLALPVARLAGVPARIATHHGRIEDTLPWFWRLHGWVVNSGIATTLVAVSERVKRWTIEKERVRPERVQVILNGIEFSSVQSDEAARRRLRAELGVPDDGLLFLTVGRLMAQKGHTFLLDAASDVLKRYPSAVFAFAGDGPLRPELEEKSKRLGIQTSLRFLGVRADVPELLHAADGFVLPSLWEGLPIALLETMAAGKAVAATRVEGVEELLIHGESGLMVPAGDGAALAQAILQLLGDAALRERLGLAARKLVERDFTLRRMCEEYEQLFAKALAGART